MTTRDLGELQIKDGPSIWDAMLSFFEGKPVNFKFVTWEGAEFDDYPFVIEGLRWCDRRRGWIHFDVQFPNDPKKPTFYFSTGGYFNLRTRRGNVLASRVPGKTASFPEELLQQ